VNYVIKTIKFYNVPLCFITQMLESLLKGKKTLHKKDNLNKDLT